MSGNAQVMNNRLMQYVPASFKITYRYFVRTNPFKALIDSIVFSLTNFLTLSQRLKSARRHVNHMMYRLNQMERLIESNNPTNYGSGRKINQIR